MYSKKNNIQNDKFSLLDKMTLGVSAVIIKKGKILLIRRRDLGIWSLPGGLVERGESFETTLLREAKEETGLKINSPKIFAIYLRTIPFFEDIFLAYQCSYSSGSLSLSRETQDIGWFNPEEIRKIAPFFVRQVVSDCLKEKKGITVRKLNLYEPIIIGKFILYRLRKKLSKLLRAL